MSTIMGVVLLQSSGCSPGGGGSDGPSVVVTVVHLRCRFRLRYRRRHGAGRMQTITLCPVLQNRQIPQIRSQNLQTP